MSFFFPFHVWYWILISRRTILWRARRSNALGGSCYIGGGDGAYNLLVSCDRGLLSDILKLGRYLKGGGLRFVHVYSHSMEL